MLSPDERRAVEATARAQDAADPADAIQIVLWRLTGGGYFRLTPDDLAFLKSLHIQP